MPFSTGKASHLTQLSVLRWRSREAARERAERGQMEPMQEGCETPQVTAELPLSACSSAREPAQALQGSVLRALRKITEQMAMAQPEACTVLINLHKPSRTMVIHFATVAASNPPHTPTHVGDHEEVLYLHLAT